MRRGGVYRVRGGVQTLYDQVRGALGSQLIGFWSPSARSGDDLVDQTGGGVTMSASGSPVFASGADGNPKLVTTTSERYVTADSYATVDGDRYSLIVLAKVASLSPASRQVLASMGRAAAAMAHISIETSEAGRFVFVWDNGNGGTTSTEVSGNFTTDLELYELHYDPRGRCGFVSGTEYQQSQDNGSLVPSTVQGESIGVAVSGISWGAGYGADMDTYAVALVRGPLRYSQRVAMRAAFNTVFPSLTIAAETSDETGARGFFSLGWTAQPAVHDSTGPATHFGTVDETGDIHAYSYNHTSGVLSGGVCIENPGQVDVHARPSFMVRDSDKRVMIAQSGHNEGYLNVGFSSSPRDASSWGTITDIASSIGSPSSMTYATPIQLEGLTDDPIFIFYRGPGNAMFYTKSTDDGATWATPVSLIDETTGKRIYFQAAKNGDSRIDFLISDGNPYVNSAVSVWYCYFDGTSLYNADDTAVTGSAPYAVTNLEQIYDGSVTRGWLEDIAIDGSGNPHLAYTTFGTPVSRRARRWNGSAWINDVQVETGTAVGTGWTYHTGGMAFNPHNTDEIYLSNPDSGTHEIYRYTTSDSGASWASAEQITSGSKYQQVGPRPPVNAAASVAKVLWQDWRAYVTIASDYWAEVRAENAW